MCSTSLDKIFTSCNILTAILVKICYYMIIYAKINCINCTVCVKYSLARFPLQIHPYICLQFLGVSSDITPPIRLKPSFQL